MHGRLSSLNSQLLATAATAACQYVAACLGLHSLAETVNLVALTLFGLISTKHFSCHPFKWDFYITPGKKLVLLTGITLSIIRKFQGRVKPFRRRKAWFA